MKNNILDTEEYVHKLAQQQADWNAAHDSSVRQDYAYLDQLLAANSSSSLSQLCDCIQESPYATDYTELADFAYIRVLCEIYTYEKTKETADTASVFSNIYSVQEAIDHFNHYKFLLINVEFDLGRSEALSELTCATAQKLVSITFLTYLIQLSCLNPLNVFQLLIIALRHSQLTAEANTLLLNTAAFLQSQQ